LYIIGLILSFLIAFLYLRYSTPVYKINAKVFIKSEEKSSGLRDKDLLEGLGILSGNSNVENEIEIFKSRSLMERVVSDLQLNVRYFIKGKVKETELYKEIPFNFHLSPYPEDSFKKNYKYKIVFDQNNLIQIEDNFGLNKNIRYGDTITLPIGKAVLTPNNNIRLDDEYFIQITSPD